MFVITHPPNGDDRVEVFELVKSTYLKHIRSITDRKFRRYILSVLTVVYFTSDLHCHTVGTRYHALSCLAVGAEGLERGVGWGRGRKTDDGCILPSRSTNSTEGNNLLNLFGVSPTPPTFFLRLCRRRRKTNLAWITGGKGGWGWVRICIRNPCKNEINIFMKYFIIKSKNICLSMWIF